MFSVLSDEEINWLRGFQVMPDGANWKVIGFRKPSLEAPLAQTDPFNPPVVVAAHLSFMAAQRLREECRKISNVR